MAPTNPHSTARSFSQNNFVMFPAAMRVLAV